MLFVLAFGIRFAESVYISNCGSSLFFLIPVLAG